MATVTKTIGTTGRDYTTITLWEADLDNAAIYTAGDDAVGEMYNDSVYNESPNINQGSNIGGVGGDMNLVTLTVASGERHDGTAGTGARIVRTASVGNNLRLDIPGVPQGVEWLEVDGNDKSTQNVLIMARGASLQTAKNCILHSTKESSTTRGASLSNISDLFNCIVYDIHTTAGAGADATGVSAAGTSTNILNVTVHNVVNDNGSGDAFGLLTGEVATSNYKNIIVTDTSGTTTGPVADYSDSDITTATAKTNISSDASVAGVGSIDSVSSASLYVSTVLGSEDLHLKEGAVAIGAGTDLGTTPTNVNTDIDDQNRDLSDSWDIGADQWRITVTKTIGTTARDYATITLWEADLDVGSIYEKDAYSIGKMYNDSVFDETVTINSGGNVGGSGSPLTDIILTVAEGERHDGTEGTGARIVRTGAGGITLSSNSTLERHLKWFELDANGNDANLRNFIGSTTPSSVERILVHGSRSTGTLIGVDSDSGALDVINTIIYDIHNTGGVSSDARGVDESTGGVVRYYNVTVHDIVAASTNGEAICFAHGNEIQNCIGTDPSSNNSANDKCFDGAAATENNNISSDTTSSGAGSIDSVTAASLFVSTTGGSEDLHIKAGADAIDAGTDLGTTPSGVEIDINGRDRDAESDTWDIGAHEIVVVAVAGTSYIHYYYEND